MADQSIYRLLCGSLRQTVRLANLDLEQLQEIRLRIDRPMLLRYQGQEYALTPQGELCRDVKKGHIVTETELSQTLESLSGYSMYAFEEERKQGFMTVEGGHRIGVAGKAVMDGGHIQCVHPVSCINIRFAHQVRGCADPVLPYLIEQGTLFHTLLLSPPRCGKTTLLRDLIRQISDGTALLEGRTVGVVDERSEIAGACRGIAQNDVGMRTDVLDGCPKAEGMMLLLRAMSPQVIAVDEIGGQKDLDALEQVIHCGCTLLATAHGSGMEDIERSPLLHQMKKQQLFERYVLLGTHPPGRVQEILDGNGARLYPGEAENGA